MSTHQRRKAADRRRETVTVDLGAECLHALDRARALLQESESSSKAITRSLALRVAILRLTLSLLADRARPDNPHCPYMEEYLRLLSISQQLQLYPHPISLPPREPKGESGRRGHDGDRRRKTP